MATVTVYGSPPSTYTRSARMFCEEKGIDHALEAPGGDAAHPFGKIPTFRHGDVTLYETTAIGRYVDEAFDGPALQPADPAGRAMMTQWMSVLVDYVYDTVVRGLVIPRLVNPRMDKPVDEDAIKANLPNIATHLGILDQGLAASDYFAGDAPSLADWLIEPVITYVTFTPEGGELMGNAPHVAAWQGRMAARPSFKATMPDF